VVRPRIGLNKGMSEGVICYAKLILVMWQQANDLMRGPAYFLYNEGDTLLVVAGEDAVHRLEVRWDDLMFCPPHLGGQVPCPTRRLHSVVLGEPASEVGYFRPEGTRRTSWIEQDVEAYTMQDLPDAPPKRETVFESEMFDFWKPECTSHLHERRDWFWHLAKEVPPLKPSMEQAIDRLGSGSRYESTGGNDASKQ